MSEEIPNFSDASVIRELKDNIESLGNEEHFLNVLKIIQNDSTNFTQNQNGVFVNMRCLKESTLLSLHQYIEFCKKSQQSLQNKEQYQNTYRDLVKNEIQTINENVNNAKDVEKTVVKESTKQKYINTESINHLVENDIKNLTVNRNKPVFSGTNARIIKKSREPANHSGTAKISQ